MTTPASGPVERFGSLLPSGPRLGRRNARRPLPSLPGSRSARGPFVKAPACLAAAVLWALSSAESAPFLVARLETRAGYEKNRLEEAGSGSGTPFWQASPGADLTVFGERIETSLSLDYQHTEYAREGFGSRNGASAFAHWQSFVRRNEVGASAGGGFYRDEVLSGNDHAFWQGRSRIIRALEGVPAELSLEATVRQTLYDSSASTSSTERADTRFDTRSGLRWHLPRHVVVWMDLYAERNASDASDAEYSGLGGAVGCDLRPAARLDTGVWAQAGARSYDEQVDGETRRDTPRRVGGWLTYRLRSWVELFASADLESFASTVDDCPYSWWQAGGGVRIVLERELRRP